MAEGEAATASPEETRALARRLGELCRGGEIIFLAGDLASGKTCFVQGLAIGLGTPEDLRVTSPTFVLHAEYPGRLRLNHLDLYRLDSPSALDSLGVWDILAEEEAVAAVEWPELLGGFPKGRLEIDIRNPGGDRREFSIRARGKREVGLLAAWLAPRQV
ncbi:MAG: tRNA (adenosine(37)-N6)-threonylcarbamoyltransferase complex ATPase subunit type 1 TsaE [Planctomycetota bacterium]|nr:tRNA (adenosine(37)-N6)-threonylcarbamoyltransferase complex ATPase subunit type 1 TsaE [Planctomycetota bacterium]